TPTMGIDDLSANYTYELGLPAPTDSRGQVISSFYTNGGTPIPDPTATGTSIPSPTPSPAATSTSTPTPTPTATRAPSPHAHPTNAPTSTSTPAGSNLLQDGGFETSSSVWVYGGTNHPG